MPLYNGVDDNVHDNMCVRGGETSEAKKRRKKANSDPEGSSDGQEEGNQGEQPEG